MPDPLDDLIDAAARALDLPIEPAWKPAVRDQSRGHAARSARSSPSFTLPDDAEPAPVFRA